MSAPQLRTGSRSSSPRATTVGLALGLALGPVLLGAAAGDALGPAVGATDGFAVMVGAHGLAVDPAAVGCAPVDTG